MNRVTPENTPTKATPCPTPLPSPTPPSRTCLTCGRIFKYPSLLKKHSERAKPCTPPSEAPAPPTETPAPPPEAAAAKPKKVRAGSKDHLKAELELERKAAAAAKAELREMKKAMARLAVTEE